MEQLSTNYTEGESNSPRARSAAKRSFGSPKENDPGGSIELHPVKRRNRISGNLRFPQDFDSIEDRSIELNTIFSDEKNTTLEFSSSTDYKKSSNIQPEKLSAEIPQRMSSLEDVITENLFYFFLGYGEFCSVTEPGKSGELTCPYSEFEAICMRIMMCNSFEDVSITGIMEKMIPLIYSVYIAKVFYEHFYNVSSSRVQQALVLAIGELFEKHIRNVLSMKEIFSDRNHGRFSLRHFWLKMRDSTHPFSVILNFLLSLMNDEALEKDIPTGTYILPGCYIINILSAKIIENRGYPEISSVYLYLTKSCWNYYCEELIDKIIHGKTVLEGIEEYLSLSNTKEEIGLLKASFREIRENEFIDLPDGILVDSLMPYKSKIMFADKYYLLINENNIKDDADITLKNQLEDEWKEYSKNIKISSELVRLIDNVEYTTKIEYLYWHANRMYKHFLFENDYIFKRLNDLRICLLFSRSNLILEFIRENITGLNSPLQNVNKSMIKINFEYSVINPLKEIIDQDIIFELDFLEETFHEYIKNISSISIENIYKGKDLNFDKDENFPEENKSKKRLYEYLGIKCITKFPLSAVINQSAIDRYTIISRCIFSCHYLVYKLSDIIISLTKHLKAEIRSSYKKNKLKDDPKPETESGHKRNRKSPGELALHVASKMLSFAREYTRYICEDIINKEWANMIQKISENMTMDSVKLAQDEFLDICIRICVTMPLSLSDKLNKLIDLCHEFSFSKCLNQILSSAPEKKSLVKDSDPNIPLISFSGGSFTKIKEKNRMPSLESLNIEFDRTMALVLDPQTYHCSDIMNCYYTLFTRLDYSLYYERQMPELNLNC